MSKRENEIHETNDFKVNHIYYEIIANNPKIRKFLIFWIALKKY